MANPGFHFFGEHHGSWFFDIFWSMAFWRPILMPLEFLIVWIYKPLPLHAAFGRVTCPRLTGTLGPSHSLENRCFFMFFCVFCSWLPGQWFFRGHQTPPVHAGLWFFRCAMLVVIHGFSFHYKCKLRSPC